MSTVRVLFFSAEFCSVLFRSEIRNWLFRGTRNASEWALSSAEQRKPFRVYSAEFFRNDIPFPTLCVLFIEIEVMLPLKLRLRKVTTVGSKTRQITCSSCKHWRGFEFYVWKLSSGAKDILKKQSSVFWICWTTHRSVGKFWRFESIQTSSSKEFQESYYFFPFEKVGGRRNLFQIWNVYHKLNTRPIVMTSLDRRSSDSCKILCDLFNIFPQSGRPH